MAREITSRKVAGCNGENWVHLADCTGDSTCSSMTQVVFFVGDCVRNLNIDDDIVQRLSLPHNIADVMSRKYPDARVVVIEPCEYTDGFACYRNFLGPLTRTGEPLGYQPKATPATAQLAGLLRGSAKDRQPDRTVLIGFSKGGIVVNQLLTELVHSTSQIQPPSASGSPMAPSTSEPASAARCLQESFAQAHYLDVGLNGRGAYLTSPAVAQGLAALPPQYRFEGVYLHGTPRQWADPRRPWLAQEVARCKDVLLQAGVKVEERRYSFDPPVAPLTLRMHFAIIDDMLPI